MFEDFDISITSAEPPPDGANVTVRFGNVSETGSFSLSAVAGAVTRLNGALLEPRPAQTTLQEAGSALFEVLFDGRPLRAYLRAVTLAGGRGAKVRLRIISSIPSIVAVPWEYLYDRDLDRWLALHADLSLDRSLPLAGGESLPVDETLRILVMLANPNGLPRLDSAREWAQLDEATATAAIDLIPIEPTYEALQGALRLQPHVFHFVGHGLFLGAGQMGEADATRHFRPADRTAEEAAPQGALAFCNARGASDLIEADRLASMLAGCKTLRLVLLNACQGSVAGARSAFAGVAQKLIQQGTPAVIAMQAPIYDDHALRFRQEFYRALADGYSIEQAVGEGRKRINEVSYAWGIPTLYFQGVEPFSIRPLSNEEKAARLWQKVERLDGAETPARRALLDQIVQLDPEHAGAGKEIKRLDGLAEAERLYAAAQANIEHEQWTNAHRALEQAERLAPNFRETRSLLAMVKGRLPKPPPPITDEERAQYQPMLNALRDGRLVPFLGWDVGRVGRPEAYDWVLGHYMPDTAEAARSLADYLAIRMDGGISLPQVSQYTILLEGMAVLYERLSDLYAADYPPTTLHMLLAELPGRLRAKGYPTNADRRYVIFSTAFDDLLERAFDAVGQLYHLFAYRHREMDATGMVQQGHFVHLPPGGEPVPLLTPNTYTGHDQDGDRIDRRPVIVKLCGQKVTPDPDSVVVTEDQYLDYLPAQEIGALLPMTLLNQVKRRNFVFFGCSLRPWHFRLLWQRMRYQRTRLHDKGWAFLPEPNHIEEEFWRSHGVAPVTAAPEGVVAYVNQWLDTLEERS